MPRPSRFSEAQILDATAAIVAADGPGAATIGAIGNVLKAPSGSIYHRFASHDVLLGRLWLSKAAFFQKPDQVTPRIASCPWEWCPLKVYCSGPDSILTLRTPRVRRDRRRTFALGPGCVKTRG